MSLWLYFVVLIKFKWEKQSFVTFFLLVVLVWYYFLLIIKENKFSLGKMKGNSSSKILGPPVNRVAMNHLFFSGVGKAFRVIHSLEKNSQRKTVLNINAI